MRMLESSVHTSVAGSQSSAENTALDSSLKPVPFVPPVSSRQVPSALSTSGIVLGEESALSPATTRMLPSASSIVVGYQRPSAIGGDLIQLDVAGSNTFTSGRPKSSLMCPPGTISFPSGMNVCPAQKIQDGAGTARKVSVEGSQMFGDPSRLQARTLPSRRSAMWVETTGHPRGASHCPSWEAAVGGCGSWTVTLMRALRVESARLVAT